MDQATIDIILQVISIALLLVLTFYKALYSERGRLKAVLQSLEKVTGIVEGVKSEITVLADRKRTFENEQRQSLLKYYSCYNSWLNHILNNFPEDSNKEKGISKIFDKGDKLYDKLVNAQADVNIYYLNDADLSKAIINIHSETVRFEAKMKFEIEDIHFYTHQIDYITSENKPENLEVMLSLMRDKKAKIETYLNENDDQFETIKPHIDNLRNLIHQKIKFEPTK